MDMLYYTFRKNSGAAGEIGRHKGLRILRREACGFESRAAHHFSWFFCVQFDFNHCAGDMYDENSDFTYNGQKITMQEYEDYMNSYVFIDPDSEKARPAP